MGRALGFERAAVARYSFLLAIPAVVGAGVYEMKEIPHGDNMYGWGPTLVATAVAFVVGYAAIAWLLKFVSHHTLAPFVIYRVLLGSGVLVLLAAGVLLVDRDRPALQRTAQPVLLVDERGDAVLDRDVVSHGVTFARAPRRRRGLACGR